MDGFFKINIQDQYTANHPKFNLTEFNETFEDLNLVSKINTISDEIVISTSYPNVKKNALANIVDPILAAGQNYYNPYEKNYIDPYQDSKNRLSLLALVNKFNKTILVITLDPKRFPTQYVDKMNKPDLQNTQNIQYIQHMYRCNTAYNNPYNSLYNTPYNTVYNTGYNNDLYNKPYHTGYNSQYNKPYQYTGYNSQYNNTTYNEYNNSQYNTAQNQTYNHSQYNNSKYNNTIYDEYRSDPICTNINSNIQQQNHNHHYFYIPGGKCKIFESFQNASIRQFERLTNIRLDLDQITKLNCDKIVMKKHTLFDNDKIKMSNNKDHHNITMIEICTYICFLFDELSYKIKSPNCKWIPVKKLQHYNDKIFGKYYKSVYLAILQHVY